MPGCKLISYVIFPGKFFRYIAYFLGRSKVKGLSLYRIWFSIRVFCMQLFLSTLTSRHLFTNRISSNWMQIGEDTVYIVYLCSARACANSQLVELSRGTRHTRRLPRIRVSGARAGGVTRNFALKSDLRVALRQNSIFQLLFSAWRAAVLQTGSFHFTREMRDSSPANLTSRFHQIDSDTSAGFCCFFACRNYRYQQRDR